MPLYLCPVKVQGEGAAKEIAAAIRRLDRMPEAEVLIVGRGGGSMEDLWPFNEEIVARRLPRVKPRWSAPSATKRTSPSQISPRICGRPPRRQRRNCACSPGKRCWTRSTSRRNEWSGA